MIVIITAAGTIIWYMIKRFLEQYAETQREHAETRKEHTEATKELTISTTILTQEMKSFQTHCAFVEQTSTNRLNKHSDQIGVLKEETTKLGSTVTEHGRRLEKVEQKINP